MKKIYRLFMLAAATASALLAPSVTSQAKSPVVVVIDPGHGGSENRGGEVLPYYIEKNITMQTALAMKQTLEQFEGVEVYLTRSSDQELSLEQRAAIGKSYHADFLFSLHYNMSFEHNLYGTEVWTSAFGRYYTAGAAFGQIHQAEFSQYGLFPKGVRQRLNSKGTDYYGVIRASRALGIPAVIIEHCYMDHAIDSPQINTADKINSFGISDALAVAKYYRLKSPSLGLDYSGYAYTPVKEPAGGTALPDTTPPPAAVLQITGTDAEKVSLTLSSGDSESGLLYYSYSLDGGLTWSILYPWAGSIANGNPGTVSFTVPAASTATQVIVARAYNGYDYHTDSNPLTVTVK